MYSPVKKGGAGLCFLQAAAKPVASPRPALAFSFLKAAAKPCPGSAPCAGFQLPWRPPQSPVPDPRRALAFSFLEGRRKALSRARAMRWLSASLKAAAKPAAAFLPF